ncbi:M20/M25/M40 family metallo-hydrolase [Clostridiales bacterium]|nr:M20/M25/M40 family metallo-hydrolase [Clostridiales bacterium]
MEEKQEPKKDLLAGIEQEIKDVLYQYLKAESFTGTAGERASERFLMKHLSQIPYFADHPEYYGTYSIEGDPFGRAVCYAMVKGEGANTVVLLHHQDVVGVEDFKRLRPYAFSPDQLGEALLTIKDSLPHDARADLEGGKFLFGRGTADMKGGGAIQLSLLERYSRLKRLKGNILLVAVPDEENLSAGMRAGVKLLADLKERHGLNYRLMINSEPHGRKDPALGTFSEGSIGKIMPFVYVRGYLSHISKNFEGFNPLNLMSEIVRNTEWNMDFFDSVKQESAPLPTWLYLKDGKTHYDVSMPLSVSGCFSVMTLKQSPALVMEKVEQICRDSFENVLADMEHKNRHFAEMAGREAGKLPWNVKVVNFAQLRSQAQQTHGRRFQEAYEKKIADLAKQLNKGSMNMIESNFALVEFLFDYVDDLAPQVVYGLIPPYYSNVSNLYFQDLEPEIAHLSKTLDAFTWETYQQHYEAEHFFTGISDLSYTSIQDGTGTLETLRTFMPLLGTCYQIPLEEIQRISMPCMNIGPWGKDLHKLTERVSKEDLYEQTPRIINKAISVVLKEPGI